jgi:hypothetical protein
MVYAATSSDVTQGGYYGPRWGMVGRPVPASPTPKGLNRNVGARLWAEAERLTGVSVEDEPQKQEGPGPDRRLTPLAGRKHHALVAAAASPGSAEPRRSPTD